MKELIPVIHIRNGFQVHDQAALCKEIGINKVFLIYHGSNMHWLDQLELALRVKEAHGLWVGINVLGIDTFYTYPVAVCYELDGFWTDTHDLSIHRMANIRPDLKHPMYFSSFEFKYQSNEITYDYIEAGADDQCDVIVTSGDKTASPPTLEKIQRFASGLGALTMDKPLAIASGISIDNVDQFLPYADYFLVASNIQDRDGFLNRDKLEALYNKIKEYHD